MNKKIIRNKNKGIFFWITGLSGSGKTTISKKIKKKIAYLYGPTIELSAEDLRKILKFNKYTQKPVGYILFNNDKPVYIIWSFV